MTWLLLSNGLPIRAGEKPPANQHVTHWCRAGDGKWTPGEPGTRKDGE